MSYALKHLAATALLVSVMIAAITGLAGETLTYRDLVKRYTDLERLAVLPIEGEKCVQWSSWDRASKYDPETGKYVAWEANGDGGGFIRKEGDNFVVAEMEGPGCIWRIWSAAPQKGHVKFCFDGEEEPEIDVEFNKLFVSEATPFNRKNLGYTAAAGWNLYMPIPYQKSCKVVLEPGWGAYYHFTYSTFPKGTTVPTFKMDLPEDSVKALDELDQFLGTKLGRDPKGRKTGEKTISKSVEVKPGQSVTLANLEGARAITAIRFKMSFGDRKSEMAPLRELALRITWDGQDKPAVWCPLGDFFGTAPGYNEFKSLPVGITGDGAYCYWYMPFAKSGLVELVNDGRTETHKAAYSITSAPLDRKFDGLGYFHAKWHRDAGPMPDDRKIDWEMLSTTGCGRFLGVMLHVWNPRGGWWGEGDEKFFIDGEKFPSTFGTGSEDYFGYAWCNPALFQKPYHGQTMSMGNAGHQAVHRWHIADNIPFMKSFQGDIEKYYPNSNETLYASTVAWYLAPGGDDPYGPAALEERTGYFEWPETVVAGFRLMEIPKHGLAMTQGLGGQPGGKWTNDTHLFWTGGQIGDELTILVDVEETGRHRLEVILTKSWDYGIIEVYLDGKKVSDALDLYSKEIVNTGPLDLGTHELEKGQHKVAFKIVGVNDEVEKTHKGCRFVGIDDILFTPVE